MYTIVISQSVFLQNASRQYMFSSQKGASSVRATSPLGFRVTYSIGREASRERIGAGGERRRIRPQGTKMNLQYAPQEHNS